MSRTSLTRSAVLVAGSLLLGGFLVHLRDAGRATAAEAPLPVTYFGHDQVEESFRKGGILLKDPHRNYQVHTSRRDGPGEAELHEQDTDVFYIREGTATFVTGGSIVDPKSTGPGEVRGPRIAGGEAHHMSKGDVIVVPHGTPHWFREVKAPFTYFTVKVR